MAEARSSQLWDHTADLLAVLYNAWLRPEGKPALTADKIHPHRMKKGPPPKEAERMPAKEGLRSLWRLTGGRN